MPSQESSHFALRQGNRRGEWRTYCGRSVREASLTTVEHADWIVCPECRAAAIAARDAYNEEKAGDPDITVGVDDEVGQPKQDAGAKRRKSEERAADDEYFRSGTRYPGQ